ncbi:MAG: helix-turn-helix transcriptional regulator [Sulfitobacter sp.]
MRSSRMFEIIQLLRSAKTPVRAQDIADQLEVTKRTIYRDMASLQAMRVPIEGEAGIGYIMRPGYNLPPINFDVEEAEAISVGLSMISRTGDKALERAALRAVQKLSAATTLSETLFSSNWGAKPADIDLGDIRNAIRQEVKLALHYRDAEANVTRRTILPIAIVYYSDVVVIAAWCEMRADFRHFRADRMISSEVLAERFKGQSQALRRDWAAVHGTEF